MPGRQPKYASRADANQTALMAAARRMGATAQSLHRVGSGCPDIIVGYRGTNLLIEIKDGAKPKSAQALTPQQVAWHADWRGQVAVISSVGELLALLKGCT